MEMHVCQRHRPGENSYIRRELGDEHVVEGDIHDLKVRDLPRGADLAWASFPCQDLSCAGDGLGIGNARGDLKTRSGTFWPFIGLMKDLKEQARLPKVVVLENVLVARFSQIEG